ncbi:putative bifunctional diguanylate cyclase/phosphodiesterase [Roseibium marinum]|uniref:Diguanylate cyclase (GGDEF)-like protein n=1 Tax=Roseibium marinum TaxID=281252 RepID=A0A2S3V4B0_9HYPH|nr:bifunctional diguanylate cyclase/phosphodiesterase [Roseibium marinum]POF34822.1 diguanylate cyclase (GGDEF)-like protein [Roseibium marinum]
MRIRGWLTGLIVFMLAPSLLFASLWFHNKIENVRAIDRSLEGLHLIEALGPLMQEKALTGKVRDLSDDFRIQLKEFGGKDSSHALLEDLEAFIAEPKVPLALRQVRNLTSSLSQLAKLSSSASSETSRLPRLIQDTLLSVVIESSNMAKNAHHLASRGEINIWDKMLIPVQAGQFKAAADEAALNTAIYLTNPTGAGAQELQEQALLFRKTNLSFQTAGSKLLSSTIKAHTGGEVISDLLIMEQPKLVRVTFLLWHAALDTLNFDLLQQRAETLFAVALAGLAGCVVILAAFAVAVTLSRVLAVRTQQEFENLGFHDPLTGLPNRRALLKTIQNLPPANEDTRTGLLVFDLRHFKKVNDLHGDQYGDSILRQVAEQLTQIAEPDDFVSRTGGTEFMLLRRRLKNPLAFEHLAARLIHELGKERYLHTHKVTLASNVGIFITQPGAVVTDQVLVDAALALRSAKKLGPGKYSLFTHNMRETFEEHGETAKQLLKALHDGNIVPWYQPQIDIHTGTLVGAEALVRWIDGNDVRTPASFLPAAMEAGYMDLIEKTVREHAIRLAASVSDRTLHPIHFGLNVSADLLGSSEAADALDRQVRSMGLLPSHISLEILEAVMIDESTVAPIKENIARLSELGFFIELDDFGTGHSSISSLRDLKVDRVKIDRSFISGVDKDPDLQKFTSALINLAKSLDIRVLAEGVETAGELEWLKQNGCDDIQGFLISKAVPEDQLLTLILKHNFLMPLTAPAPRKTVLGLGH